MCDFKPGDEVVCVDAGDIPSPVPDMVRASGVLPNEGQIYTVVDLVTSHGEIGVVLREIRSAHRTGGYVASRFRKVQRRDLSAWLKTSVGNTDKLDKRRRQKA